MFTQAQMRAMVIVPKITAVPSLVGTALIAQHVARSGRRLATVYHRLLLAMACHDFLFALAQFAGTWMNPAQYGSTMWLAAGNQQTCTANGFIRQGGLLTSIIYSMCLTLFFLLVIRFRWREGSIKRVEPFMHGTGLAVGWGAAIAGLFLNLYNPYAWGCGIVAWPFGCTQSYQATPESPANCERGDNAGIYSWAFAVGWVWAASLFLAISMAIIYRQIYNQETRSAQYEYGERMDYDARVSTTEELEHEQEGSPSAFSPDDELEHTSSSSLSRPPSSNRRRRRLSRRRSSRLSREYRKRSRQFAIQALLYCSFFFLAFTFGSINVICVNWGPKRPYFPLMILQTIFGPLQGFFNFLVYFRPRYLAARKYDPDKPFCILFCELFSFRKSSSPSSPSSREDTNNETSQTYNNSAEVDTLRQSDYLE